MISATLNHDLFLKGATIALFALSLLVLLFPSVSFAGCVPGLPCITNATPNDPLDATDGPNVAPAPNASMSESAACDADFMNQVYANAVLSAERNTIAANVLIRKPDSVLEYSCFDQIAALTARSHGPIFSERRHTGTLPLTQGGGSVSYTVDLGNTSLDTAIENLVLNGINRYISDSFSHTFLLGGGGAIDTDFSASVGGAGATCTFLSEVYEISRCRDAFDQVPYSAMTFANLVTNDFRTRPAACPSNHQITQNLIDLANNANFQYVNFDQVDSHNDMILYDAGGGANCTASPPIPTGLMVVHEEYTTDILGNPTLSNTYTYEDKVCANPSCYFDNNNDANGSNDRCRQ